MRCGVKAGAGMLATAPRLIREASGSLAR